MPFHFKQSQFGTVQEEIDGFGLGDPFLMGKLDWVDAEQSVIVAAVDQCLQFGHHPRRPGVDTFELPQQFIQQCFIHSYRIHEKILNPLAKYLMRFKTGMLYVKQCYIISFGEGIVPQFNEGLILYFMESTPDYLEH